MKKIIILIMCVFFTVSCKTVKNIEEENDKNVIDYGSFQKVRVFNPRTGDSTWSYKGDITAIINYLGGTNYTAEELAAETRQVTSNQCKKNVSVFPNPTSSSATINVDVRGAGLDPPRQRVGFKYKLIFDEKVIYENDNTAFNGQEVIPTHLLQNTGTYVVAYELYYGLDGNSNRTFCTNTVNFMVTGK